jgi:hypothetical protein
MTNDTTLVVEGDGIRSGVRHIREREADVWINAGHSSPTPSSRLISRLFQSNKWKDRKE